MFAVSVNTDTVAPRKCKGYIDWSIGFSRTDRSEHTYSLIDIACHQAGAQVLTLLFTSAPNPIRELMIQTVVSVPTNLRLQCCRPSVTILIGWLLICHFPRFSEA